MRRGRPPRSAFALAYTLLVSAVLMLFAGALFSRSTETLRLTGSDVNSVHASALADTGAQLAYSLLRDHDPLYFKSQNPLRSVDLGPEFAVSKIGGTFEVVVDDADYTATGLYPDNGTFYTVVSTGRVGNHVARSEMTLKMTNPLLNYLFLAPRTLRLGGGREVVGPIVVNADPSSGSPGNLIFSHAEEYYNPIRHGYQMDQADLKLDIQARASGNIQIANDSDHGMTAPPLELNGRYPAQSLQHQDFTILDPSGSWRDSVVFTDEVALEANAKFTTKVPNMKRLLKKYRDGTGSPALDISSQAGGVLVEFVNGMVHVSEAKRRQIGRVYDRALADDAQSELLYNYELYFGVSTAAAQSLLDSEVAIDDPQFPDDAYPADIGPGTGDYVEVWRIERGAPLASYPLSDNWTTLYLTTSRVDYPTADGRTQGPPVFVRGMVDGKAMVVYEVTNDALDPDEDKLHMVILANHEMADDSPTYKLPSGGAPGVNGGLLYADRAIKSDPDQTVFTNDRCVLLCRGTVTVGGDSGSHRGRMHDMAGNPVDHRAQLNALDQQYSNFYTGKPDDRNFRCSRSSPELWSDGPRGHFFGIAVSSHSDNEDWRITSKGEVVVGHDMLHSRGGWFWKDLPMTPPPGEGPTNIALFPMALRRGLVHRGASGDVNGSFHSVVTSLDLEGNARYDYSWQALKEGEIRGEMFLPVVPVIANFQRL